MTNKPNPNIVAELKRLMHEQDKKIHEQKVREAGLIKSLIGINGKQIN